MQYFDFNIQVLVQTKKKMHTAVVDCDDCRIIVQCTLSPDPKQFCTLTLLPTWCLI